MQHDDGNHIAHILNSSPGSRASEQNFCENLELLILKPIFWIVKHKHKWIKHKNANILKDEMSAKLCYSIKPIKS